MMAINIGRGLNKIFFLVTLLFILGCETTKQYQTLNTSSNGYGKIEWSDGQSITGNFTSESYCEDCTFFTSRNIRHKGNFAVDNNNSWNFINGKTYIASFNDNNGYYEVEYTKPYNSYNWKNPVKVYYDNKTYEINMNDFSDVAEIIAISRPLGLSYDEALKECKRLGFEDGTEALLNCVLEIS